MSAHPRHTFPGIVKSQMNRLRKLCSRDSDFRDAVKNLELRCLNSGYQKTMVTEILNSAASLMRNLRVVYKPILNNKLNVRLITLAGTSYVKKFKDFASRMNTILINSNVRIEIVQCTSTPLSKLLFNNGNGPRNIGTSDECAACRNNMVNDTGVVSSNVTGRQFKVNTTLSCCDGGIYVIDTNCSAQYTGKTIHYGIRSNEHFLQGGTAISPHIRNCEICNNAVEFNLTFVESYLQRGKYTLSEREYLWNTRIRGSINTHKILGT